MRDQQALERYRATGEIGSGLALDAVLAVENAKNKWQGIRLECADFEAKHILEYAKIKDDLFQMQMAMKEFEFKHWMGFCDKDVLQLLELYREWETCVWDGSNIDRETYLRDLWNPWPEDQDLWTPFRDRRSRKPLREAINDYNGWGSTQTPSMKIMLGSSSGRVLLTLQDRFPQGDPQGIYGGAWISLIFDESADRPRGGIQGHCATKKEAIGMIQAITNEMPILQHNPSLAIG